MEMPYLPISNQQKEILAGLEGLVSREVGERLAELASSVPADQAIVEIGSYRGKSTAYLASGAAVGYDAKVYAFDPWDLPGNVGGRFGFDQAETLAAFDRQIHIAGVQVSAEKAFSIDAARRWAGPKIGLLYIDGSHTEKDVRADWQAWRRHLAPDAILAFDDYGTIRNPGVAVVVHELIQFYRGTWEFEPKPLAIGRAKWT